MSKYISEKQSASSKNQLLLDEFVKLEDAIRKIECATEGFDEALQEVEALVKAATKGKFGKDKK